MCVKSFVRIFIYQLHSIRSIFLIEIRREGVNRKYLSGFECRREIFCKQIEWLRRGFLGARIKIFANLQLRVCKSLTIMSNWSQNVCWRKKVRYALMSKVDWFFCVDQEKYDEKLRRQGETLVFLKFKYLITMTTASFFLSGSCVDFRNAKCQRQRFRINLWRGDKRNIGKISENLPAAEVICLFS